jgi:hypothetical protein
MQKLGIDVLANSVLVCLDDIEEMHEYPSRRLAHRFAPLQPQIRFRTIVEGLPADGMQRLLQHTAVDPLQLQFVLQRGQHFRHGLGEASYRHHRDAAAQAYPPLDAIDPITLDRGAHHRLVLAIEYAEFVTTVLQADQRQQAPLFKQWRKTLAHDALWKILGKPRHVDHIDGHDIQSRVPFTQAQAQLIAILLGQEQHAGSIEAPVEGVEVDALER